MIAEEYVGKCKHNRQVAEIEEHDEEVIYITTCDDCGSVYNEFEEIWYV